MNRIVSALGNKFSFSITNATGSTVVVALLAAMFNTLAAVSPAAPGDPIVFNHASAAEIVTAGYACGAVADDGTPVANLTFTPTNARFTIRQFKNYIKESGGLLCKEIVIQGNNVDVFEKSIEVVKYSPLSGSASQYLNLSDFKSVDQQDNSKIIIREPNLELAFDVLMLLPVDTGRTVTITFKF